MGDAMEVRVDIIFRRNQAKPKPKFKPKPKSKPKPKLKPKRKPKPKPKSKPIHSKTISF